MARNKLEYLYTFTVWAIGVSALLVLLVILGDVLIKGVGEVSLSFLTEAPKEMGKEGGVFPAIVATIYMTVLAILVATPVGVGTAIYLTQYAKPGRFTRVITYSTECLAAVPSIIFGLFGLAFFVVFLKMGLSVLAGGLTLSLMVLPTIIRTSQQAIDTVPESYREGSLALGGTRYQTILRVILPSALPGILTGVILSIGRAIGETAAIIYTAGGALGLPISPFDPARNLSYHLFLLATEVGAMGKAYGAAVVLVVIILALNFIATWLVNRFKAKLS